MNRGLSGNFLFWQKWLLYSSLLIALSGITITLGDTNPFLEEYERLLTRNLFKDSHLGSDGAIVLQFLRGPFGATICCAYLLLSCIAAGPFKRKERWSRNAIAITFGIWFILDTVFCISYNMYFQAFVLNGISLLQKALPLIFTWKEFNE